MIVQILSFFLFKDRAIEPASYFMEPAPAKKAAPATLLSATANGYPLHTRASTNSAISSASLVFETPLAIPVQLLTSRENPVK